MDNYIEIMKLSKTIDGSPVLKDITVTLEAGKIYGFVGRNGSGKTMLFRTLAGFIKPSEGEIICNGKKNLWGSPFPLRRGIMIENAGLYQEFSGIDNLKFLASIRNEVTLEHIKETIRKVGLNPEDKRKIKKYSLGMKQRITFAQAIMEEPELLLLDEPTNALDEGGVQQIRSLILAEKKRGAIVCIASHNAEDIDVLCDFIYEMKAGEVRRKV